MSTPEPEIRINSRKPDQTQCMVRGCDAPAVKTIELEGRRTKWCAAHFVQVFRLAP